MLIERGPDLEEQYDKIYRYCYFKLHDADLAEDITQVTFLRFFESKRYRDVGKEIRYLYTIAGNLCIDHYRRNACKKFDSFENFSDKLLPRELQEESGEERLVNAIAVKKALSELPDREQEILLLRYANEVPVSTIGGLLGISRFTVNRIIKSGLSKLYDKLGKENF